LISSIIGAHPPLSRILAVGTDGESNLSAAILNNLPFAQHVRCAVHLRRDIQEKMKEIGVPKQYQSFFVEDVMGSFHSPHAIGLVDANTPEEFDEMLSNLQSVWQKREAEFSSRSPVVYQWFVKYHAEDVRNFMITTVRERVGLGKPPSHYTTNANESINNVVKQALHYEEKDWDKFCDEMFKLVKIQYQELEKAVIRTGEYRFKANFAHLEKSLAAWTKMSVEQRKRHIKKVMYAKINDPPSNGSDDDTAITSSSRFNVTSLPTPSNISSEVWECMVSKAQAIASDPVSMSPVPGANGKSRFVVSFRNPDSPLKVQAGKSPGQYSCDKKKCPAFAGYKICSHVLAVALQNNESKELLKSGHSNGASLHDVAMIGMPNNAGKKPGCVKKRSRKKKCIQDENRVPAFHPMLNNTSRINTSRINSDNTEPLLNSSTNCDTNCETSAASFTSVVSIPQSTSSLPPPLIPVTHEVTTQVLPVSQIQINQQPSHCSHTSMKVTAPFSAVSMPPLGAVNYLSQRQANPLHPQSNPFFVKFLTKQIKVCQGCRSGYQRGLNGDALPPPYDIVIGHFERQQYSYQVTGITRLSRETCAHYHAFPQCILAKFPNFQPTELSIPNEVLLKLNATHKSFLNSTFGTCL